MRGQEEKPPSLKARAKTIYRWANRGSRGVLGIVRGAIESFGDAHGSEAAASLAYYSLFSLFPLLLVLVAAGGYLVDTQHAFQRVVDLVSRVFPLSQDLIEGTLTEVLQVRGAVGLVSLGVAIWSASSAFLSLTRNINRAWRTAPPQGFLQDRLMALGMVGSLAVLLAISLLFSTALNVLSRFQVPLLHVQSLYGTPIWTALSNLVPAFFIFLLVMALYRWVPKTKVRWPAAFWPALVVALAWEVAANAFAWYLGSDLARYRLVYGSLATVVALLFWVYLSGWIIIFGAHLSAAVARQLSGGSEGMMTSQPRLGLPADVLI